MLYVYIVLGESYRCSSSISQISAICVYDIRLVIGAALALVRLVLYVYIVLG